MGCLLVRLFYFLSYLSILLFIRCRGSILHTGLIWNKTLSNTNVTFSLNVFQLPLSATFFFYRTVQPEEANTTTFDFCALFSYYVYYYYLRCAYSSWSMYTKRYHIVKDNNGYEKPRYKEGKIVSKVPFISRV